MCFDVGLQPNTTYKHFFHDLKQEITSLKVSTVYLCVFKTVLKHDAALFQVILSFPECFWREYSEKTDTFGHIPNSKEQRGFCGIFYDLSPKVSLP